MLTHRNFIYGATPTLRQRGMLDQAFEVVCYLPLCHVAERSYSTVLHLMTGGCVNFAESIDTVATNIREIAPTFFLGVPRIWEKLQQGIEFRMKDSTRLQRWACRAHAARAAAVRAREQRGGQRTSGATGCSSPCCGTLLFRNMQRHMGLDRTHCACAAARRVSPEVLKFFRHHRPARVPGLRPDRVGRLSSCTSTAGRASLGSCGTAMRGH
jgi:long-chain acyl-CoA synthetase